MLQSTDLNQQGYSARAHLPEATLPTATSLESDAASNALQHTETNDTVSPTDSTSPNSIRVTLEEIGSISKTIPLATESAPSQKSAAFTITEIEAAETDEDNREETSMLPTPNDHSLSLGTSNDNGMFLKSKTAVRRAASNGSSSQPVTTTTLSHHATRTLIWISAAALVALGVLVVKGKNHAAEFVTAYIVEYSLSVDNLFVFLLIFRFFNVPAAPQQSILTYGIIGAMVLRGVMIVCGKALVQRFEWVGLVFAALLIYSAGKLLFEDDDDETDLSDNQIIRFTRRILPVSERYAGDRFFIWENGRLLATPLMVVLVSIEFSDVVFAVDSVPAVLALSSDTFVIYMSNILAIMGLRSLFFVLATSIGNLRFLKQALAITLAFIGIKMIAGCFGKDFSTTFSLCFIALTLASGVLLSIMLPSPSSTTSLPTNCVESGASQVPTPPLHNSTSGAASQHSRSNSESFVDNTKFVRVMINPVDRTEDLVRALAARHSIDLSEKDSHQRVLRPVSADDSGSKIERGNEAIHRARALWKAMQDSRGMLTRAAEGYGNFGPTGMTDAERDSVDRAVGQFVAHALKEIEQLKRVAVTRVSAKDAQYASEAAHLLGIVALLSDGLQDLSATGQRLRDRRIRQALAARKRPHRVAYDAAAARELALAEAAKMSDADDTGIPADGENHENGETGLNENDVSEDAQLMQQLARENVTLVNDLVETRERVQEAERTVYAIANMNQVFTTKVLEQAQEIETLYNLAVEASTFTQRGNRELRKLERKGHFVKYLLAGIAFFLALTLLVAERLSRRRR